MIFSLDVIRALKGDCLILHYGSEDSPHLVMIDGGPKGVYGPHLRPRLEQIRADRGLTDQESRLGRRQSPLPGGPGPPNG